jgi:hypothetical protein
MSFVRLLELWSELEPERCTYVSGFFTIRGWSVSFDTDATERLTQAEIQCAVQEAIENHGWNWFAGRIKIENAYYFKARIAIPEAPPMLSKELNAYLSSDSAARALLSAYLQAMRTYREYVKFMEKRGNSKNNGFLDARTHL